jgi:hypothetical protein
MIIAVDFDGTIVEHAYPEIGKEIPFAIETLKMLQQDQHLLVLWTVREGDLLDEAVKYCEDKGLIFYAINSNMPDRVDEQFSTRKVSVDLFIDDRNLGGLPEWGIIYQMIKNNKAFEPYNYEIQNEYTKKTKKSVINKILGL